MKERYKMPFPLTVSKEWKEYKDLTTFEVKKITQKAAYIEISDRGYLNSLVLDIIDDNGCTINVQRMGIQKVYLKCWDMWRDGKLTKING